MDKRYILIIPCLLILFSFITGCATTDPTDKTAGDSSDVTIDNPDLTLLDYMRRIPGLQITQTQGGINIMVRGASTVSGENSPLYIVDRSPLGYSFSQLESAVSVSDIESIRVLRSSDAMQRYGMRAANGAIIIQTKQQ
ncbi:MAG: TonB-dependent receptor plug domain-containing protein [Balneolaceae bacterium]